MLHYCWFTKLIRACPAAGASKRAATKVATWHPYAVNGYPLATVLSRGSATGAAQIGGILTCTNSIYHEFNKCISVTVLWYEWTVLCHAGGGSTCSIVPNDDKEMAVSISHAEYYAAFSAWWFTSNLA